MRRPQRRHHLKPQITAHAVIDMHDQIAGREALRLGQEILGLAALFRRADQAVPQHVLLADDGQAIRLEPLIQRPDSQMQPVFRDRARIRHMHGPHQPLVTDQPVQTFPRPFRE